jgi:hypothetical protein
MKLIVNRENDIKKSSKIRRSFSGEEDAYFLLLELLSHQSGFNPSTEYLQELLGWNNKKWEREAKKLEERGHLYRYRQTGTNNWTFVVYESPQEKTLESKPKEKKENKQPAEPRKVEDMKVEKQIVVEIEFEASPEKPIKEKIKVIKKSERNDKYYIPKIPPSTKIIDVQNVHTVTVEDALSNRKYNEDVELPF